VRIQPVAPIYFHTVEDGEIFDTEILSCSLSSVAWFANPQQFTENGAGPKSMKVDTNLVGLGNCLARGYSMTARRLAVQIEGAPMSDFELLKNMRLDLDLAGERSVESIRIGLALAPNGALLAKAWEIAELECFNVSLRFPSLPNGLTARPRMRVALLGPIRVPIESSGDGSDVKRAEEFYGRSKPAKEPALAWLLVHEGCARPGEKTWERGAITRRAWDSERARDLDAIDPQRKIYKRRDPRRAWWCTRCGEKVTKIDLVVGVEVT
jgi:hypothetical protein